MDLNELTRKIIDMVSRAWEQGHAPVLLAQIGSNNDNEIATAAREIKVSLSRLIETSLKNDLRVIRHSKQRQRIAVIPRTSETDKIVDTDLLFDAIPVLPKVRRYDPGFWFAFQQPLTPSNRRYVTLTTPVVMVDLGEKVDAPAGSIEIGREFVLGAVKSKEEASLVHSAIEGWAAKAGIDLSNFEIRPSQKGGPTHTVGNLLDAVINCLEGEQLKRVSLPMDVVASLLKRKI